ncbi:hypothetical protein KUCAC02_031466 [Chaenocephalus aceratus]|nr:hypothetical protein KUCAC02_031466 [Chaenocephalus aceratus]
MYTFFISEVVWFSSIPKEILGCTPIRPHPTSFFGHVTESDPCCSLSRVRAFDQGFDKVLFLSAVDRHQVASHGHTVELCISPGHLCVEVLVEAAVEGGPGGTAVLLWLHWVI